MDFLGLRNLDVIADTVALIRAHARRRPRHRRRPARRRHDLRAAAARATRSACSSSRAARCARSCARSRPTCFDDVAALVALYRPGPDGGQHAQRLRRPQERPQAGRVPHPRRRGGARRHLRADDLPGVGHAGRAEVRRLLPGRGRQPAQGVRQEDPRADRARSARSSSPAASTTGYGAELGNAVVRHHRALRRLRLQQEPLLRLRPRRLPDRLPQGALPGRVPRLPAHQREGQPRQGRGLPQRVPADGHPVLVPDVNLSDVGLRSPCSTSTTPGITGLDPVRAVGRAQRRRGPRGPDRRRARGQRSVHRLLRLLRPRRLERAQQARDRVADQGRRLRLARPPAPGPAGRVRADHRPHAWPAAARRPKASSSCSRAADVGGDSAFDDARIEIPDLEFDKRSASRSRRRCSGST